MTRLNVRAAALSLVVTAVALLCVAGVADRQHSDVLASATAKAVVASSQTVQRIEIVGKRIPA